MRVVFLDFDGVLNNADWIHKMHAAGHKHASFLQKHQDDLNPDAVKLVSDFVLEMEARVVISSSWRILHPIGELRIMLKNRGWDDRNLIIDKTPRTSRGFRGDEVNQWLSEHPEVTSHVIFDDDGDFHDIQPLVKTTWDSGITPFHIQVAKDLLTKPLW
jgi:HAD domain in Swiss Army Knife RNA repair proteins